MLTYENYTYVLTAIDIAANGGLSTPDVRIDDADFEVLQIKSRAYLGDTLGTAIEGTPLLVNPSTTTNTTMPSIHVLKGRLNIEDRWLHSERIPLDLLGAYTQGDDGFLAAPFTIRKRSKVFADLHNASAAVIHAYIALIGRKIRGN